MPFCAEIFTPADLAAYLNAGYPRLGGPFDTEAQCLANCPSSGSVTVTKSVGNICANSTPLASGIIQGSGFSSPATSNILNMLDAGGNTISTTITGGTANTLDFQLLSPIIVLSQVTAKVMNGDGVVSNGGAYTQVYTAINCGGGGGGGLNCQCDPLPTTMTARLRNINNCLCADIGPPIIIQYNSILGTYTGESGPICGQTMSLQVSCTVIAGVPTYELAINTLIPGAGRIFAFLTVNSCSPLDLSVEVDLSTIPGMCAGTAEIRITA
jgi:hypothetical protein